MPYTESATHRLHNVKKVVDKYLIFDETAFKSHIAIQATLGKVLNDIHQLYLLGRTDKWTNAVDDWAGMMKRYWTIAPEYALTYGAIKTMEKAF